MLSRPCVRQLLRHSRYESIRHSSLVTQPCQRLLKPTLEKSGTHSVLRVIISQRIQLFSIQRNELSTNIKKKLNDRWWKKFRYLATGIKIIRIPFLVLSVYYLGYQQGIIDYSRNPVKKRSELLQQILDQYVGNDSSKVVFATEGQPMQSLTATKTIHAQKLRKFATIAEQIVKTARVHVSNEMESSLKQHVLSLDPEDQNDSETALSEKLSNDLKGYQKWKDATDRMGLRIDNKVEEKWTFILIETPILNAFVSEMMPQCIFVSTSMLDLTSNDDELAVILGHEISHLILGHNSRQNYLESMLRVLEVFFLSLDPTEGILSVFVMELIRFVRKGISAGYSRHAEMEADQLGIKIAAMSCFDTKRGCYIFRKLATYPEDVENKDVKEQRSNASLTDTHPAPMNRYLDLQSLSGEENADKYNNCKTLKKKLASALIFSSYK